MNDSIKLPIAKVGRTVRISSYGREIAVYDSCGQLLAHVSPKRSAAFEVQPKQREAGDQTHPHWVETWR